jgi:hypothetical protein
MSQDIAWPWRGGPEHAESAGRSELVHTRISQVSRGLDLLAYAIDRSAESVNDTRATNELSAIACYTRAFRGLRAATILAMEGLYLEARVYVRDVYESAGLARMLAKNPVKADDWLIRDRWIKDNEVRQYIESVLMPGASIEESPYREYYRQSSELHHPTRRGCLPLVLSSSDMVCRPQLESAFDEPELDSVLHEIAIESTFVAFTMINAVPDQDVIPPDWRRALTVLSTELLPGADLAHLERNWREDEERYADLHSHVIQADRLDAELDRQPNSVKNVQRRRDQQRAEPNKQRE